MNKKGQEMSISTLVIIILAIVVLVLVVLGFTMGWSNLWGKINILGGGGGVETVIQACKLAVTSDSTFSYCNEFKKVTIDGQTQYINCEAPQVIGLDKKLSCNLARVVSDECALLKSQNVDLTKTKVNGQYCQSSASGTAGASVSAVAGSGAIAITLPGSSFDISQKIILQGGFV